MEKTCPSCDAILLDKGKGCPFCTIPIIVYDDGFGYDCPICGAKLQSHQTQCLVCETIFEVDEDERLREELFQCPDCGRLFAEFVFACPDCGSEFEGAEEEPVK